ncbi:MAG: hypothetical protein IKX21_00840 [Deltaproteobacteria bacterium]|nr:hypothetical protein [Deltaproteobacteria bacterium]
MEDRITPAGRNYRRYVGKFAFEPPAAAFEADIQGHRAEILAAFRGLDPAESNCFARRFTRRYIGRDGRILKKDKYSYVFDIVPRNVVDFKIDPSRGRFYLYVLGVGQ